MNNAERVVSINLNDAMGSVNKILSKLSSIDFNFDPLFDGKIHRFSRRSKNKSAWYIARLIPTPHGDYPIVCCGDWATSEKHTIKPDAKELNGSAEHVKKAIAEMMAEEEKCRAERQEVAKQVAVEQWEIAEPRRESEYMRRKGFDGNFGARVAKDGTLLIPTIFDGEMVGLQRVAPDGQKRFLAGQRMKGAYFIIGNITPENPAYLCEGFATACSINVATGRPVVVAFAASNMPEVARAFSGYKIVPAADNDRFTEGNPGAVAAEKCIAYLGYKPVMPTFPDGDDKSTDFNDLHIRYGLSETRKQLEADMGEVVGIRSRVAAKAKVRMSDVYRKIAEAIDGKNASPVPDFPYRFHVVEPSPGTRLIAQETEPMVLHYVSEKAVVHAILQYAHALYLPRTGDGVGFEHKHASEAMKFWRGYVEPIPEPKMVSWPGEEGYTLRRLPWEMKKGDTPLFNEMMGRTTNAEALQCFIGSLFFSQADLQQYVWIKGLGQNGKGALSRFLRRALNGAYSSQTVPTIGDKFWTSGLIGARLVVFPDCNNRTFVSSGLFKSLTGGDPVKIEQKGQQPFTTELKAKFMFLSNETPHLSSEKADMRRAIYCEMQEIKEKPRAGYEDDLWLEGGRFLAKCFSLYSEKCNGHGQIEIKDNEALDNVVTSLEEEFEVAVQKHFKVGPSQNCLPTHFQKKLDFIWPRDKKSQYEFRAWLERKHAVRKKTSRDHGDAKIYTGISVIGFSSVETKSADKPADGCGHQGRTPESHVGLDVDGADI